MAPTAPLDQGCDTIQLTTSPESFISSDDCGPIQTPNDAPLPRTSTVTTA